MPTSYPQRMRTWHAPGDQEIAPVAQDTSCPLHDATVPAWSVSASSGPPCKCRWKRTSTAVLKLCLACRVNILQTVMHGGLGSHGLQDLLAQQWSQPPRLRCGPMDATSFRHALPAHFVSLLRVQHACLRGCLKIMTWNLGRDGPGLKCTIMTSWQGVITAAHVQANLSSG